MMQVTTYNVNQPKRKNNYRAAALGAGVGAAASAIVPTKQELNKIFNKEAVDKFVSTSATKERLADRSMGKFAFIGALAAVGMNLLSRVFASNPQNDTSIDYSKWGAIIDANGDACLMTWYGDTNEK